MLEGQVTAVPCGCELVVPAGTLEKLETAVRFGADGVYAAGKSFGLRAGAGNLNREEMRQGVRIAHAAGVKVYVTVNASARNSDLTALPSFLEEVASAGADGIIVADPGVMRLAARHIPKMPVTVSTQANVCNFEAARFYEDLGVKRIVLARELCLEDIASIRSHVKVELEVFVHGAMCVAYSGRCLLSLYMTGRSANRGECAHPCRYSYSLVEEKRPGQYYAVEEDESGSYLLNSRDLCLLAWIPQLMAAGVNALKIEGRMKSPLYVATVASVYRQAIIACQTAPRDFEEKLDLWLSALQSVSPRPFTNGFINGPDPNMNDVFKDEPAVRSEFCAMVMAGESRPGSLVLEQRANFGPGEGLEILQPSGEILPLLIRELCDQEGQPLDRARHPRQKVTVPFNGPVEEGSIVRRVVAVDVPR